MKRTVATALALLVAVSCGSSGSRESTPSMSVSASVAPAVALFLSNQVEAARDSLEALHAGRPGDAEIMAWLCEARRRTGDLEGAIQIGEQAVAVDSCQNVAHTALAALVSPAYSPGRHTGYEHAWEHIQKAIACDRDDGNAWLLAWHEGVRRNDPNLEGRALDRLGAGGFFSPSALAYGRWVLEHLPERAVLLTGGDMDTYPLLVLQRTEKLRPDVAVINAGLLELDWYRMAMSQRHGLPLPSKELTPFTDELGRTIEVRDQVARSWMARAPQLARPIALAVTLGGLNLVPGTDAMIALAGAYTRYSPQGEPDPLDETAIWESLREVDSAEFKGPFTSEADRSPIRRDASRYLPQDLAVAGIFAASEAANADRIELAQEILGWVNAFNDVIPIPIAEGHPMYGRYRAMLDYVASRSE